MDFATKQRKPLPCRPHKIRLASERCSRVPTLSDTLLNGANFPGRTKKNLSTWNLSLIHGHCLCKILPYWGIYEEQFIYTQCDSIQNPPHPTPFSVDPSFVGVK